MSTTTIEAARRTLGPAGVYLPAPPAAVPTVAEQRAAVQRLERAGWRMLWVNETVGGKDALVQLAILLAATERMSFGTGIANIWARPPQTAHAAAAQLAQAYPGRLVLGLGAGYPPQAAAVGRAFGTPLTTLRDYLDAMTAPTRPLAPDAPYARIIGANGPKMLALSAQAADGALPIMRPPEFTAQARRALGPDKLLVIGLAVAADRAAAREQLAAQLAFQGDAFTSALSRLGFSHQEVAALDDRVVDALVAHGDPTAVTAKIREHLTAGADHVALIPDSTEDFTADITDLAALAPALP